MRLSNWHFHFLECPNILHDIGAQFLLNLVTDDIAGIRGRNRQNLGLEIGHQFPVLHAQ